MHHRTHPKDGGLNDGDAAFYGAVEEANAILAKQRGMIALLGAEVPASAHAAETARLIASTQDGAGADGYRLLQLSLAEIAARQALLSGAVEKMHQNALNAVALDAFVHAMHRIRTTIDVALGCSEEAAELSTEPDVVQASRDAAAALRLIYHYAVEMDDLSSLSSMANPDAAESTDCTATLQTAIDGLAHVARDAKVEVINANTGASVIMRTNAQLLRRTLSYLILTSIVSPGARRVACCVEAVSDEPMIKFSVISDGRGSTLEDRTFAGSANALLAAAPQASSDASGFAVARRLAKALGGRIELETMRGAGDTLTLFVPLTAPGA